jgi:hypothetical protein
MPVGLLRRSCSHWKMSATEIARTERETMMTELATKLSTQDLQED